jgi:hypothetical protein
MFNLWEAALTTALAPVSAPASSAAPARTATFGEPSHERTPSAASSSRSTILFDGVASRRVGHGDAAHGARAADYGDAHSSPSSDRYAQPIGS